MIVRLLGIALFSIAIQSVQAQSQPIKKNSSTVSAKFLLVAAGNNHFAALDDKGQLWVWGENNFGQLGLGDDNEIRALANGVEIQRSRPEIVGTHYQSVAASGSYTLAIKDDGSLWGWGAQVPGLDFSNLYKKPTLISREPLTQIFAGGDYALGMDQKNVLWEYGRVGEPSKSAMTSGSMRAFIIDDVATVSAHIRHAAIVLNDHTGWTFGKENRNGILGKSPEKYKVVTQIGADDRIAADTGLLFTQFKTMNGNSVYLGDMGYLKPFLGQVISENKDKLVVQSTYQTILNFDTQYRGSRAVYLLKENGDLEIVRASFVDGKASAQSPVNIGSGFQMIKGSNDSFIGLKKDGSVWTWGQRSKGLLVQEIDTQETDQPQAVKFVSADHTH